MKKNGLYSDEIWAFASFDAGEGAGMPVHEGARDTFFVDDDSDPYPLAENAGSSSSAVSAAKPVASIATLADYLINGFWQSRTPTEIAHHWVSHTITYNITGLNSAEQFLAQSALQAWSEVANITFVQTSGSANITFTHNGTMQAYAGAPYYGSGAIAYAYVNISTDWVTTDGGANDGKTGIDSYAYQTYIHEIGHALGLGHQGPYDGSASYSTNALYANDTWQYSVMSYFPEYNYSGSSYRYVVTPQMADIYAVASMYGAATSTRTGDTVYGFNSNAGAVFNFGNYTSAPALTIYDSGGTDTLDCSGYSGAQTIDLHAGAFCSIGSLVNNIGIALSAVIEKAIGGSGNDKLIASDTGCTLSGGGGADTLDGGAGNDTIVGGSGTDVAVFSGAQSNYVIAFNSATQTFTVVDQRSSGQLDGADTLTGVENFQFSDGTFASTTFLGPPTVIEALGATSLVQISSYYFLQSNSSGAGPQLYCYGAPVVVGQFGAWTPIGTEQTGSGYQVVLKNGTSDSYIIWSVDSNGNYITNTAPASGTSSTIETLEVSFQQDLNGDGTIGVPIASGTAIESFGSTKLVQVGSNYYLASVSSNSGPELYCYGAPVVVGQFGAWTPIGTEQTGSGYQVVLKNGTSDSYIIWSVDSNGNYITNTAPASGTSSTIETLEVSFQQDLNGDGTIGVPIASGTAIESFGSTKLVQVGSNYYLASVSSNSGPELYCYGAPVVVGQFGAWTPIGTEQTGSGYQVVLKNGTSDSYIIWSVDSNGNYITNTAPASGTSSTIETLEVSFQQDLNGDGTIGVPVASGTAIESFGSTKLVQVGNNYYLEAISNGSGPELKCYGSPVVAGQFGAWTPIGTEQTTTGYQVVLKYGTADSYIVWSVDSGGNYITNTAPASGASSTIKTLEASFQQDLNGDGVISVGASVAPSAASSLEASSLDMSQVAPATPGSRDAFLFRTDFGEQGGGTDSVWLAEFSAPASDANLGALLRVAQADSLFHAANGGQDAIINIYNHDDAKLQLTELHAGFFFLH